MTAFKRSSYILFALYLFAFEAFGQTPEAARQPRLLDCAANQIVKRNAGNTAWACAADTDTDDQTAAEVPFTPNGSIQATNVQAAIQEVRDEAVIGPNSIGAAEINETDNYLFTGTIVTATTVASLGTATLNTFKIVSDGNPTCGFGGGIFFRLCRGNGTTWDTVGDGGITVHNDSTGRDDTSGHTWAPIITSVTGADPAAGSCLSARHIIIRTDDTPFPSAWICSGAGANPVKTHSGSAAYNQFGDGTNSASSEAGGEPFRFARASTLATEVEVFNGVRGVNFTNQPANDGIEIVCPAGDVTQVVTFYGNTSGGDKSDITIETKTCNGATPVATTKTNWGDLLAVKVSPAPTGTITVREASGDLTITTALNASVLRAANQDTVFYKGTRDVGVSIYHDANQSITTATPTKVAFNTERYDTDTMHDAGANTKITFTTAGKYLVTCQFQWEANATGIRSAQLKMNDTSFLQVDTRLAAGTAEATNSLSRIWNFAATDYVEIVVYQDSTVSLNLLTGAVSPECQAQKLN